MKNLASIICLPKNKLNSFLQGLTKNLEMVIILIT